MKLWQIDTGECLQTFQAHPSLVLAIAFSPDGQVLATGGGDGTINLWDVSEFLHSPTSHSHHPPPLLATLLGHQKWIRFLVYSPTGDILASCSQDGSIKLWDGHLHKRSGETQQCLKTLRVPRPYEGTNITGMNGLTQAEKETLRMLGAIDESSN